MAYSKHNFTDGQTLTAASLNDMDDQIAANELAASSAKTAAATEKTRAQSAESALQTALGSKLEEAEFDHQIDNRVTLDIVGGILSANGNITTSSSYRRSDYVKVKKGQKVSVRCAYAGSNINILSFFDSSKIYKSDKSVAGTGATVVSNIDYTVEVDGYIIISNYYSTTHVPVMVTITPTVKSVAMTESVLSANSIMVKRESVADGTVIIAETNSIRKNYTIKLYAKLSGGSLPAGAYFSLGHGQDGVTHGEYIKVDNTNIIFHTTDNGGRDGTTKAHTLTISTYIDITLTVYPDCTFNIRIDTLGGSFSYYFNSTWMGDRGNVFAAVNGVSLTWTVLTYSADWQKNKWIFGDSYCSNYSSARMPYWLQKRGFDNFLLNAFPGAKSANAYADWTAALKHGAPKYAYWLLGMNDKDVDDVTPNASWLECVSNFIADCYERGVEPVLSTIPNVPNTSCKNTAKNRWVRQSGLRYIDAEEAVGSRGGTSWYDGCIGSDNTHPSERGAVLLCARTLADAPELMEGTIHTENYAIQRI